MDGWTDCWGVSWDRSHQRLCGQQKNICYTHTKELFLAISGLSDSNSGDIISPPPTLCSGHHPSPACLAFSFICSPCVAIFFLNETHVCSWNHKWRCQAYNLSFPPDKCPNESKSPIRGWWSTPACRTYSPIHFVTYSIVQVHYLAGDCNIWLQQKTMVECLVLCRTTSRNSNASLDITGRCNGPPNAISSDLNSIVYGP